MATLINNAGVQHYANKMVLAENRKVGSKSLPTALADIDNLIDEMKTHFDAEYGSALDMKLNNNENVFSVGTGTNVDKSSEVENSFTDVELSGNSVVNLCPQTYNFTTVTTKGEAILDGLDVTYNSPTYRIKAFTLTQPLKPNTTYTAIVNILSLVNSGVVASYVKYSDDEAVYNQFSATQLGLNIKKFTTSNKIATELAYYLHEGECSAKISGVIILEGDWTNKPIPQYFEGMKSVGQDDVNGHKIEILSRNKNLLLPTARDKKIPIFLKKGTTLTLSTKDNAISNGGNIMMYDVNGEVVWFSIDTGQTSVTRTLPRDIYYMKDVLSYDVNYELKYQLEISNTKTSYVEPKQNKKEISLNEPLRGLPNGIRDTIEKVNGEWKIVRRCGELTINPDDIRREGNGVTGDSRWIMAKNSDIANLTQTSIVHVLCNKYPSTTAGHTWSSSGEGMAQNNSGNRIYLFLNKYKEGSEENKTNLKEEIGNNTKVIYQLTTPVIEDISPVTLQCWKNGTIFIDEVLPVETTHTVALNKPAQIKRNIEELTALRKRVQALEDFYDQIALEQAHQLSLINHSIELDYDI